MAGVCLDIPQLLSSIRMTCEYMSGCESTGSTRTRRVRPASERPTGSRRASGTVRSRRAPLHRGRAPALTPGACGRACAFLACVFFFQAEDGIRDLTVTGVQTCALPILRIGADRRHHEELRGAVPDGDPRQLDDVGEVNLAERIRRARLLHGRAQATENVKIGRASCRERV